MKSFSVVLVEDHQLIRQMWIALFASHPDVRMVGECGKPDDAIDLCRSKKPDIVLLDINLGKESGLDAILSIRKYSPGTKIIAVSMHNQPAYAKKAFSLGARGYVTKNSSPAEVMKAIEVALEGGTYICDEIRESVFAKTFEKGDDKFNTLSMREIEIAKLIRGGYSSKNIAEQLEISARTVEVHRYNILRKLKLKSTIALVHYMNDSGQFL